MPAKQVMEMLVTGEFISAEEARARGLVNHAVAPGEVDAQVARLVESILAKPRLALAVGKDLFYRQREMGIEAAYQLAAQTMAANMMDGCALEGVTAFTEKRKPNWTL
jgi:enoyl-CoA hydratase/carnithine racemase